MSDFPKNNQNDFRRHAPATQRNAEVIISTLKSYIKDSGVILELASGTGEHAVAMADCFPNCLWLPSDIDDDNLKSIEAWRHFKNPTNLLPPVKIDALEEKWCVEDEQFFCHLGYSGQRISAILAINLIHISPWEVTSGVIKGASRLLKPGGLLYFYGPYKIEGHHTAPSNEEFDKWLKSRDPSWGVRDLEEVKSVATNSGFSHLITIPMPANNYSVIFCKY